MSVDVTAVGAANRGLLVAIANTWRDFVAGGADVRPDPSPGGAKVSSINPSTAVHSTGPDFTLHVLGSAFVQGFHKVIFNGAEKPTTWVSAGELTALIKPSGFVSAGNASVKASGAEGSASFTFT